MIRAILIFPIRCYQRWISPLIPPKCRFTPTCSQFAIDAIRAHGAAKGPVLAMWRILRCNPFCEGGYDPVPARGAWRGDRTTPPAFAEKSDG